MIFLSGRAPFACVDSDFELFVCCKFKLSRFKTKEWKDYGESSLKCGFVAPPSYPSKHVDGATAIFIRGLPYLTSCIGAENDGDDWSVHVLACSRENFQAMEATKVTHFLASLFTTRSYLLSFSACLLHRYPFSLCLFLHLLSKKFSSLFLPFLSFVNLSTATQQRTSSHGLEDTQQIHHSRFWRWLRVCRSTRCCSCQSNHQGHARREKPVRRSQRGPLCLPRDEVG